MHRATVIRHIDALEERIGSKIFRRHAKGYSKTELGDELLSAARRVEEEIDRFVGRGRIESSKATGRFVVATQPPSAPTLIINAVRAFRRRQRNVAVHYLLCPKTPKLECGEADVYFLFGPKPQTPDYVVSPILGVPRRAIRAPSLL